MIFAVVAGSRWKMKHQRYIYIYSCSQISWHHLIFVLVPHYILAPLSVFKLGCDWLVSGCGFYLPVGRVREGGDRNAENMSRTGNHFWGYISFILALFSRIYTKQTLIMLCGKVLVCPGDCIGGSHVSCLLCSWDTVQNSRIAKLAILKVL